MACRATFQARYLSSFDGTQKMEKCPKNGKNVVDAFIADSRREVSRIFTNLFGDETRRESRKWLFSRPITLFVLLSLLLLQIILPGILFPARSVRVEPESSSSHLESNRGPLSKKLISLNIILGASGSRRALTNLPPSASPQNHPPPGSRESARPHPHPPSNRFLASRPLEP